MPYCPCSPTLLPPPPTTTFFLSRRQFTEAARGVGYGLGVSVLLEGGGAGGSELSGAGEFGWGGVAGTWFFVDPKHDLVSGRPRALCILSWDPQ